jgi:hypothetical protein
MLEKNYSVENLMQSSESTHEKKIENSSTIVSVSYNSTFQSLTVTFKGNKESYTYFDVPFAVYQNLIDADSAGKYFAGNIKKNYTFSKKAQQRQK